MSDILNRINSYQNLDPEYGSRMLTNHLPMALFALHKLGADNLDLDRFSENYIKKHKLSPPHPVTNILLNDEKWLNHLGKREYYSDFKRFFAVRLEKLGRETFLKIYFNPLVPGISAAAYHGFIRLAYGVISNNDEEILSGMAYLADSYLELQGPLPEVSENAISLHKQLSFISEQLSTAQLTLPILKGVIFQKMEIVSQFEVLAKVSCKIALPKGATIKDFSEISLNLYLSTKNFTALHTLTSCHALRIMAPYIEDETSYLRYYFQSLIAAYLTFNAPPIREHSPTITHIDERFIEQVKNVGRQSNNDHIIKLTYSILEESRAYNNPLYLNSALLLFPELEYKNKA